MLDYRILSNKEKVSVLKDGKKIEYIDLLSNTLPYNLTNIGTGKYIIVNEYYVARPDLIALAVYGDDKYGDIICKVNGISNPFELNENMVIYIPNIEVVTGITRDINYGSDILSSFTSSSTVKKNTIKGKQNPISSKNLETIDKKSNSNLQKYKNQKRSPSEQTVSDKNYYIDKSNGLVIY